MIRTTNHTVFLTLLLLLTAQATSALTSAAVPKPYDLDDPADTASRTRDDTDFVLYDAHRYSTSVGLFFRVNTHIV